MTDLETFEEYEVIFVVYTEAADTDDAVETAKQLIGQRTFNPVSVKVLK